MTHLPYISVILPTYNQVQYLSLAIDSILEQTASDFELIIIDDCSTDDTAKVLSMYKTLDKRVQIIRNRNNIGIARSLNLGLEVARAEFIARMDSDDISLPKRFEYQIDYLEKHQNVGILGTQVNFIDLDGNNIPPYPWELPSEHNEIAWRLLYSTPICHPTVMMRKSVLLRNKTHTYNGNYKNEDMHLWVQMVFETTLMNLDKKLLHYRLGKEKNALLDVLLPSQIIKVSGEYIKKILGVEAPPHMISHIFNLYKHKGYWNEEIPLSEALAISELIARIFKKMVEKNILDEITTLQQETFFAPLERLLINSFDSANIWELDQ